ncbi:MAG: NAD-dependent epimerase/dehydratase family protein, partial [Bacteroidota bacterium]
MKKDNVLVIGALGQIGSDLIPELQNIYGEGHVIASDIVEKRNLKRNLQVTASLYEHLNILDSERLGTLIRKYKVSQIYLLAAILSAKGESNPKFAWRLNMEGLINVLEAAVQYGCKVFWPSSIAVFGPKSPPIQTPQDTMMNPITIYGISKQAGEGWAAYYHLRYKVDIRSLRYPGLISYKALPGGGTTDYAVDIFYQALQKGSYTCFLSEDLALPMMYMPDAIRATLELMHADADRITIRSSYNLAGISFSPGQISQEIQRHIPHFSTVYAPDFRQEIAESWPRS